MSAAVLAALTCFSACGKSTGSVSGQITFQGQPLAEGTVTFLTEHGKAVSSMIHDGSYIVNKIEIGSAKITVHVYPPSPMTHPPTGPKTSASPPLAEFVPIPARYGDPKKSGLSCDVRGGSQTLDLTLER